MGHSVKTEENRKRQMGLKLANFRRKLAFSLGEKKITQAEFGEMYGGYSGRVIASYELGDVEIPGLLLYDLWEKGNCINSLFADGEISESGQRAARGLYEQTTGVSLHWLDDEDKRKLAFELEERLHHDKATQRGISQETLVELSGRRKASSSAQSKTKKRGGT